jgi:flavin-dependent dehydrogenase
MDKVIIYGAGMSGMIAAINLAREGHEVEVYDMEKGYGGSRIYNPSTHTTPIDLERTAEYVGIDLEPVFHPLIACPWYYGETKAQAPAGKLFSVERGDRPGSLDTMLYRQCEELGVKFTFDSPLRRSDIAGLPPGTIVACGLIPAAYEMLDVPYLRWYGWTSRGEIGFSNYSWIYLDPSISEFGYLSSANNYYFDLFYSTSPVSREALRRYEEFIKRHEGVEHRDWEYVSGAVPIARPDNPRLFRGDLIMCGTISGAMDPLMWFGILGAIISGKIAAIAVTDRARAEAEFAYFTRRFRAAFWLKNQVYYRVRPHVKAMGRVIDAVGVKRVERLVKQVETRNLPGSIPGYAMLGCH